jgi:hypothetical protein
MFFSFSLFFHVFPRVLYFSAPIDIFFRDRASPETFSHLVSDAAIWIRVNWIRNFEPIFEEVVDFFFFG